MSITIKGKTYRNIQEQVEKNKNDIEEIIKGGGHPIQPGAITTDKLADSSVTTDKIVNGAVTGEKLQDHSVDLNKLALGILNNFLLTTKEFGANTKAHIKYDEVVEGEPQIHLYFENGCGMSIYEDEIGFYDTQNQTYITVRELINVKEWYDSLKDDLRYDEEEGSIVIENIYRLIAKNITVDTLTITGTETIEGNLTVEGDTYLGNTYIEELRASEDKDKIDLDDKLQYYTFMRENVTQFMVMAGDGPDDFYPVAGLLTTPNNRNVANDLLLFANLDFDLQITDPTWLATLKTECKLFFDYLSFQESYGYTGSNEESGGQIDSHGRGQLCSKWTKNGEEYSFYMYCYRPDPYTQPNKYDLRIILSNDSTSTTHFYCKYDPDTDTIDSATFVNDGTYPGITVFPIYGIKNTK